MKTKMEQFNDNEYIDEQQKAIEDNPSLNNWAFTRQLKKIFNINKNACPKEETILYSNKGRQIKVFGRIVKVKGLFRLPSVAQVEVNDGVKTTKLNKHMFPRTLFMKKEAKMARTFLCKRCPINNCSYKIK